MMYLESMFRLQGRRTGLALVREQGLDLEVWNGAPRPCWSTGVLCTDKADLLSTDTVDIPKVPSWLLVLPTYLCTTRYCRLPSSDLAEIGAMLEFELPRLAPCNTQPWTWDYSIVDTVEDGGSQVLVILSPLSVVESAMASARALGIEPRLVTVSAAVHAMRLARSKGAKEWGRTGYVCWDHGALDFLVMDGTKPLFLRGIRTREDDLGVLNRLKVEVGRSLALLENCEYRSAELTLHVGGSNPQVPYLVERLSQLPGVQIEPAGDWMSHGAEWVDRIGKGVACTNLLPRHLKEKSRRLRHRRQIVVHGLRVCLVVLLAMLCLHASLWRMTALLGQHQRRLTEIAPLAEKLQFLQGQLGMIQTQVQGSVSMLDIISQLYQVLPPEVTIHYLSIDRDRQIVVRAQAKWLSQAFDCIDPLERSAYFSNVRQNYAHLREIEGQVLIDFELRADLEKPTVKG